MREISNAKQESSVQSVLQHIRSNLSRGPPLLVVLCGPSHAGKSTFARRLGENFTTISSYEIRKQLHTSFEGPKNETRVWEIFESTKCKALKEGRNIVLDACHISEKSRWHALQGLNWHHRKICIVFDLPWQAIRDRCIKAKRLYLQEVERMWTAFQESKPTQKKLTELGFDEAYFVTALSRVLLASNAKATHQRKMPFQRH